MSTNFKLKRIKDGQEFELSEVSLLVGRSESCDIQVIEGHPSREHARVAERDGCVFVQDLHSTNGTFVNNKRIEQDAHLRPGDVVKFGEEAFSVQSLSAPEATVLMRSLGVGANVSATVIDDEDEDDYDEDSTAMLELYAMPPGWDDGGGAFGDQAGKLDDKKRFAIDRYVEKFSLKLKGQKAVFLILLSDDNLPVFKCLTVKDDKKAWTFGRASDNDVVFDNPCVSKLHANISYEKGEWVIADAGSTNGLTCKGRKQEQVSLEDNMALEISTVDVLVRFVK